MANLADMPILLNHRMPFRVKFDGADKIPSQVRTNIPHRMFAIETKGDGACGMHAVFGHPDANSELSLPDARAKAVIAAGPYHSVESASNSGIFATAVQSSLWPELALPYLKENPCTEASLFWQTLSEMSPGLAADSRHIRHGKGKSIGSRCFEDECPSRQ